MHRSRSFIADVDQLDTAGVEDVAKDLQYHRVSLVEAAGEQVSLS